MKPALTHARFLRAVDCAAMLFDVPRACILGRRRLVPIACARLAVYAALYAACDTSSTEIAQRVGRDHTTVLAGIRRAMQRAKANPEYAEHVGTIMQAAAA